MKIRNIVLTSAAVLFCTASISATTIAHTWVSGSGSDTNPCTFALPCLTFQHALANTTGGGIITAKDAGDFGSVIISQSVTIDGANMGSIGFGGAGEGIYLSQSGMNPITVILHNLTINGQGTGSNGIYFSGQGNLIIDNCRIEGFTSDGVEAVNNAAENIAITNTVIVGGNIGSYGFVIYSGSGTVISSLNHVTIQGATNAAVLSDSGLLEISDSVITQSYYAVLANAGSTISVASSMITANTIGVCSNASSKIRLDNNDIYDNPTAIGNCGGIVKTSTTNKVSGTIAIPAADISESVTF
jgi:hypothetical protein